MANDMWSIPPIKTTLSDTALNDSGVQLEQGVIVELVITATTLLQNVSENEDDKIEFSFHGEEDGVWGRLNTGSLLKIDRTIFVLNRTHKDIALLSVLGTA